jgi:hypothetical protein
MLSPFLRAKGHWELGEPRAAIAALEEILGEHALYVSDDVANDRIEGPFESFLVGMLADDDHLLIGFDEAMAKLWAAFPAPYAASAVRAREALGGEATWQPDADPDDWERLAPDVLANRFIDAVFHRARVMDRSMVLDALDRVDDALLDPIADTLERWDPAELAQGMRANDPACAEQLIGVLRSRDFDALPATCFSGA